MARGANPLMFFLFFSEYRFKKYSASNGISSRRSRSEIPPHHAQVRLAQPGDIAEIFGKADEKGNFVIGYTREQGHPVVINMEKFVQRSSGVFGATGTGKSFLTRMVLAGLIQYNKASVLVFDMHNEYGLDDVASDTRQTVTGLRTKFGTKVQVIGLGSATRVDELRVEWPAIDAGAGPVQPDATILTNVAAGEPGQTLSIRHPELPPR